MGILRLKYTVAVRTLCEFTAKQGDLDVRFTPSPSAQEGIEGHARVVARRGPDYRSEVPLAGAYRHLLVRGRADGYDAAQRRVEEIKTYRGNLDRQPENHRALHWAQVKIYGWLLCQTLDLPEIELALVYWDIGTQRETVLTQTCAASVLQHFFETQCERFLAWAEQELKHRETRNQALSDLRFPHGNWRTGQRGLAEAVYKAAASGRCLMAQAPTGIGKTIGTLFPLLKACPTQRLDKVFFLSAKTSGRKLALDALDLLNRDTPQMPLRVLESVARDKACEHPGTACHGEACPLAKGFYDRLPQARSAAVSSHTVWDKFHLRTMALAHGICPYYLGQELVRWSDIVIGDYNYYFDLNAGLYGQTVSNGWRIGILVDEAHNLVERARQMYSAELDQRALATARQAAPAALKKALDRMQRAWNALNRTADCDVAHATLPNTLLAALQNGVSAITDYLAEHPTTADSDLQNLYFALLHFTRLAESFGEHSLFDITARNNTGDGPTVLCIRNVIPAPFLQPRFAGTHTATLFSATLQPQRFYSDILGLPEDTVWLEVDSPFHEDQLSVRVAHRISTRFADRDASIEPIVALMAGQMTRQPGNYLAFFSSYDYLARVAAAFEMAHPHLPVWKQSPRMRESEQAAFLDRFTSSGQGIGFAVLGGAFAEGIDLPGDRLIGAFIATLGLPQVNPVNERMKERIDHLLGTGYDDTYLYPGLRKVVQAAGRVIRTQTDRGVVYLMDDRFNRAQVRALLPGWWKVGRVDEEAPPLDPAHRSRGIGKR